MDNQKEKEERIRQSLLQLGKSIDKLANLFDPPSKEPLPPLVDDANVHYELDIQICVFDGDMISITGANNELQFSIAQWRKWLLNMTALSLNSTMYADHEEMSYLVSELNTFCQIIEKGVIDHKLAA